MRTKHIISSAHKKKLNNYKGVFINFPVSEYKNTPYPNNTISINEVEFLNTLPTKDNLQLIYDADKTLEYFTSELREIGVYEELQYDKKLKSLLNSISPFIIELKHYFKRPRPNEIQEVDYVWLQSGQTPSYPSGHSTQARFISLYLADKYPYLKKEMLSIRDNIGVSRILARIHYPSDHAVGKKLGTHLFCHYKKFSPNSNLFI